MVRYIIAMLVAMLLIASAALFVRQVHRGIEDQVRQALRNQKHAGGFPPDFQEVDIEAGAVPDMQMSLPANLEWRLKLAYLLTDFWYIFAPLTVIACLGLAFVLFRKPIEK